MTLLELAKSRRYRIRNLHDGFPVPPARRVGRKGGSRGSEDRFDAVVGLRSYVFQDRNRLEFSIFRTKKAAGYAIREARKFGGIIAQDGDTEFGGWMEDSPISREEVFNLVRVSKLNAPTKGNADRLRKKRAASDRAA